MLPHLQNQRRSTSATYPSDTVMNWQRWARRPGLAGWAGCHWQGGQGRTGAQTCAPRPTPQNMRPAPSAPVRPEPHPGHGFWVTQSPRPDISGEAGINFGDTFCILSAPYLADKPGKLPGRATRQVALLPGCAL